MRATRRRLLRCLVLAITAAAIAAGGTAADTTPTPTTGQATDVTSIGATLNGTITPSSSQVAYEFQYGTTTSYGNATIPLVLPASATPETVAARIGGLKPQTTYHFRLDISTSVAQPTATSTTYVPVDYGGLDGTFTTTAAGTVNLASTRLRVRHGKAAATLSCASTAGCNGTVTLEKTFKLGGGANLVTFGSAPFSLAAGARGEVAIALSNMATSALASGRPHRETADLVVKTSTSQKGFRRRVVLIG